MIVQIWKSTLKDGTNIFKFCRLSRELILQYIEDLFQKFG